MIRWHRLASLLVLAACTSAPAPEQPHEQYDAHVALEFRTSPLVMCEASSQFVAVAVGWTGTGDPPSQDPPDVTWQSADTSIVRIAAKGEIVARRSGKTSVTAFAHWGSRVGREALPVEVLPGGIDTVASNETDRLVCGK